MAQQYDPKHIENAVTLWILNQIEKEGKTEREWVKSVGLSKSSEARILRRAKSNPESTSWSISQIVSIINTKDVDPFAFVNQIREIAEKYDKETLLSEINKIGRKKRKNQKTAI